MGLKSALNAAAHSTRLRPCGLARAASCHAKTPAVQPEPATLGSARWRRLSRPVPRPDSVCKTCRSRPNVRQFLHIPIIAKDFVARSMTASCLTTASTPHGHGDEMREDQCRQSKERRARRREPDQRRRRLAKSPPSVRLPQSLTRSTAARSNATPDPGQDAEPSLENEL